jgi:hypothetical protein
LLLHGLIGDRVDLDEGFRGHEPGHLDARAGRRIAAEELAPHIPVLRLEGRAQRHHEVGRQADDRRHAHAGVLGEQPFDLLEDVACLRCDIAFTHELTGLVVRRLARQPHVVAAAGQQGEGLVDFMKRRRGDRGDAGHVGAFPHALDIPLRCASPRRNVPR